MSLRRQPSSGMRASPHTPPTIREGTPSSGSQDKDDWGEDRRRGAAVDEEEEEEDDLYRGFGALAGGAVQRALTGTGERVSPGTSMAGSMRPPTAVLAAGTTEAARPMTSVKAAGFRSVDAPPPTASARAALQTRSGETFATGPSGPTGGGRDGGSGPEAVSPYEAARDLERQVHRLLESSAAAGAKGDRVRAVEKAKEAVRREQQLKTYRQRHLEIAAQQRQQQQLLMANQRRIMMEQGHDVGDVAPEAEAGADALQHNHDLTFAVMVNLGAQFAAAGMPNEGLAAFTQVVKNRDFAHAGRIRVNMGNIYFEQQKYQSAIKMYRMALDQIGQTSPAAGLKIRRNIGNAFVRLGQFQEAILSYEAVMDNGPDVRTGFNLLLCYFATGDRDKMKRGFLQLLAVQRSQDVAMGGFDAETAALGASGASSGFGGGAADPDADGDEGGGDESDLPPTQFRGGGGSSAGRGPHSRSARGGSGGAGSPGAGPASSGEDDVDAAEDLEARSKDELRKELQERRRQAHRFVLMAAKLIAPAIGNDSVPEAHASGRRGSSVSEHHHGAAADEAGAGAGAAAGSEQEHQHVEAKLAGYDWIIQQLRSVSGGGGDLSPRGDGAAAEAVGLDGGGAGDGSGADDYFAGLAMEMEIVKGLVLLRSGRIESAIAVFKSFESRGGVPALVGGASADETTSAALAAAVGGGALDHAATNLSFLYFFEGDLKGAEKYADLAGRVDRYNARALVNKANVLFAQGRFQGAQELYMEAIGVETDCVEAIYNLGLTYRRTGQLERAMHAFKKLHRILPKDELTTYQIASIYEEAGEAAAALEWYKILQGSVPNDPRVLARVGALQSHLGDEKAALHSYTDAYHAYANSIDVIAWLGAYYLSCATPNFETAAFFFERAAEVEPHVSKWRLGVAACHRRMGNIQTALGIYRAVHQLDPDNVECLRGLVALCRDLGDPEFDHFVKLLGKAERTRPPQGAGGAAGGGASYESDRQQQHQLQHPPGGHTSAMDEENYQAGLRSLAASGREQELRRNDREQFDGGTWSPLPQDAPPELEPSGPLLDERFNESIPDINRANPLRRGDGNDADPWVSENVDALLP